MVGRSKYLKCRVWVKVNNQKNNFLSQVGKETLLNAMVQSIPKFFMSVFRLSSKLCKEISSIMSKF